MKLLKKLYQIHSESGHEKKIRKFIRWWINNNVDGPFEMWTDKHGNLYVKKGESETYPCVVAHMDQVQRIHSKDFNALEAGSVIIGYSAKNRRQEGLGADDKNGVWVALQCLQKYDNIKVAFFVEEEIGCIGSSATDMEFFSDVRFVVQCDRRGNADFISTAGWTDLCSQEFIDAIGIEDFGYKEEKGMLTDVLTLKENCLEVSCCNLSCGYYEPHTDHEVTNTSDLIKCLNLVYHIIDTCVDVYPHICSCSYNTGLVSKKYYDFYEGLWVDYYDEIFELLSMYPDMSFSEVLSALKSSQEDNQFINEDDIRRAYFEARYDVHSQLISGYKYADLVKDDNKVEEPVASNEGAIR